MNELDLQRVAYAWTALVRAECSGVGSEAQQTKAGSFGYSLACAYWEAKTREVGCTWEIAWPKGLEGRAALAPAVTELAMAMGRYAATRSPADATFLLGSAYTAALPADHRSANGVYYTPPVYAVRLLDCAQAAGLDWGFASVLDPAAGVGAFLVEMALRMCTALPGTTPPATKLTNLASRLHGMELDATSAAMAHVLLEGALLPLCISADRRLPRLVQCRDALEPCGEGAYDLVVGNPPYGKCAVTEQRKARYARSLFGHPNLYGLFMDQALTLAKPSGLIAYLTPTSFLGGQYFKNLRRLLTTQARPLAVEFLENREGVFSEVLQEVALTVFRKQEDAPVTAQNAPSYVSVSSTRALADSALETEVLGRVELPADGAPWLLPRVPQDQAFLTRLAAMPTRLADLGYEVATGPLVWNRHKEQLRDSATQGELPLIWAEAITLDGFAHRADKRSHAPFIAVRPSQAHLVSDACCVLVQRTTSKEQARRLVAAVLPQAFLNQHGGAVVENHLNIVRPRKTALVSPQAVCVVLNSPWADQAFRCISGSVAVSAYELGALPMPSAEVIQEVDKLLAQGANPEFVLSTIGRAYGAV